ncbi:hypothetical protein A5774_09690 [Corynebacterium sp. EPI-003-04-2554_SCH2473622]|nr:hypothetical protein A5774_09690 [Corynebacterium sp. EPI-003-04-2554_SCH2473622]
MLAIPFRKHFWIPLLMQGPQDFLRIALELWLFEVRIQQLFPGARAQIVLFHPQARVGHDLQHNPGFEFLKL